jgi:peptide chain release factor 1
MLDKLAEVEKRYEELERLMSDPQLLNQQREYSKLAKERAELEEIVARFREWRKVEQEIQENRQLLEENDEAIRNWLKKSAAAPAQKDLENRLKFLILKDPNDSKNVMIEIGRHGRGRSGAFWRRALSHVHALR